MRERRKIMNLRPALIVALSVVFGILSSFVFYKSGIIALLIPFFFFALLILSLFFFFGRVNHKVPLLILAFVFFVFSAFSFYFSLTRYKDAERGDHIYSVTGRVKSAVKTDYGEKAVITDLILSDVNSEYDLTLYVYGEKGLDIGDKVRFTEKIYDESLFYEGEFSAEKVQANKRYTSTVHAGDLTVYGNYRTFFEDANVWIRNSLKAGLDSAEFSVAYALLTGDDSFIDEEVIDGFRNAGIAHVFAVSGLHIGFVALIFSFIFRKLKMNEILSSVITVLILVAYSGICGFSASSLRATVMCAVLLLSKIIGKRYDGLSSVFCAMTIVLLISPVQLFCVGFELSFSVVIFITLFTRPIAKAFKFLPRNIAVSLGAVVSAFFAGIPVSLIAFGKFSLVAVPFNLIFIPVVGVLFISLFILCIIGGIFSVSAVLLYPINYALKVAVGVVTFFDYGALMVGGISVGIFSLFYYLSFFFSSGLLNLKKSVAIIFSAIFMAVSLTGCTVLTIGEHKSVKCYVTGGERFSGAVVSSENMSVMVVAAASESFSTSTVRRLKERKNVESLAALFILDCIVDEQIILTKVYSELKVERLYVFGSEDADFKRAVERSFPNISVIFTDETDIAFGNFTVRYAAKGQSAVLTANGRTVAFFKRFGEKDGGYGDITGKYDVAVGIDYLSEIKTRTAAKTVVSFCRNDSYEDGETDGIYSFYLDKGLK